MNFYKENEKINEMNFNSKELLDLSVSVTF